MAQHIYEATTDPVAAPNGIGHHWVNTTTGANFISSGTASVGDWIQSGGASAWGTITGTLSAQTDLDTALSGKQAGPLTGDVTTSGASASIASDAVTNAKLANMATATFKGRTTGGTGDPEDLTATQATALLNNFVGDSGSGGTKGLVLAPGAGDAAAGKFLKADGTWNIPAGSASGDVVGPASATNSGFAKFDGTTGKLLKDSPATISNADVNASAAIDFSKLATLTDGNILVGSAGNVATSVNPSGDIDISNAGVFSIASGVIVNADINGSAAIDATKIADGSVTSTEFQYLGDVTSLIQAQLNNKQAVGSYITDTTGDVVATGPGSVSATIQANAVSSAKFRQSVAVSVVGRSANSTGDVADIAAASNGQALVRASNALSFVTMDNTYISDFTEAAQDAAGAMVSSSDFQYTDATPLLTAKKTVEIKVFDDATTITTGDGKYYWIVPSQFNARVIIGVFATVSTVSSSGTPTVQIHNLTDAVDVLSTALTIDVSEYTSDTAATPAVINTSNDDLATGDRIRIDVDVAGTGAKGLSVGIIIGV